MGQRLSLPMLAVGRAARRPLGAAGVTPLAALIRARIAADGPAPARRLHGALPRPPEHGYYATRDPLGRAGDFVTAPEISQMFGELIGAWAAQVWLDQGRPDALRPRRARPRPRHADARRAARRRARLPGFARRGAALAGRDEPGAPRPAGRDAGGRRPAAGRRRRRSCRPGRSIVIANEFFDALPIRQFQRADALWRERRVGGRRRRARLRLGPRRGRTPRSTPASPRRRTARSSR